MCDSFLDAGVTRTQAAGRKLSHRGADSGRIEKEGQGRDVIKWNLSEGLLYVHQGVQTFCATLDAVCCALGLDQSHHSGLSFRIKLNLLLRDIFMHFANAGTFCPQKKCCLSSQ